MACPCRFWPLVLGSVMLVIVYGLCFGGVEFRVKPSGACSCVTGQCPSLNHSYLLRKVRVPGFFLRDRATKFHDIYMYLLHMAIRKLDLALAKAQLQDIAG